MIFCLVSLKSVMWVVCMIGLLLLLAGHVGTLALAYHHHATGQDDGKLGAELLIGGSILCFIFPLLALDCLLPGYAKALHKAWLTLHVTYTYDLARHAVLVMYLQVMPVMNKFGLDSLVTSLNTLVVEPPGTGLLLVILARCVLGSGDEGESEDENKATDHLTYMVVGGEVVQVSQSSVGALRLPSHPASTVFPT